MQLNLAWTAFINWNKDFIGKAATLKARKDGPDQRLVTMVINVDAIDVSNDEAILKDGQAVGYVSSGGYAHRVGQSMAMGYVKTAYAGAGTKLQVEILGLFYDAEILGAAAYDPNGALMRVIYPAFIPVFAPSCARLCIARHR